MTEKKSPPSYEEAIARLEAIVQALETGQAPLESSVKLFEEGVLLADDLEKRLKSMEEKIKRLQSQDDEDSTELTELPFDV